MSSFLGSRTDVLSTRKKMLAGLVLSAFLVLLLAINAYGVEDNTPPQITAFNLEPGQINTENASQDVTLTVTLTDDQAGVSSWNDGGGHGMVELRLRPSIGTQMVDFLPQRISGTDLNGVYQAKVSVPRGSQEGTWTVEYISLVDKLGNSQSLNNDQLELLFGAGVTSINNTATVSDHTAAQITAFNLEPAQINTENASQDVTLTVTLTDDQAGVSSWNDGGGHGMVQLRLRPLIGTQMVDFSPQRISGTDLNGIYQGKVTLPMGSKEGVWVVEYLYLVDKLGNSQSLNADQLSPLGALSIVNTAQAQTVTIEREWTISTTSTAVTFPANTVVTRQEGGSFAFYQMASQEFSVDVLAPDDPTGTPVNTLRIGIPGLNIDFSQNVTISLSVGSQYDGYRFFIQSLGEGEAAWANETEGVVENGMISFTVNHATYFSASVALNDTIAPAATLSVPSYSTNKSTTTNFYVDWSATDPTPSAGIESYDVQYKIKQTGTWTNWKTAITSRTARFSGTKGNTYYFRARARDRAGHTGAWSTTWPTVVPYNQRVANYFGSWATANGSSFYLESAAYSGVRGARANYDFSRARSLALIVTKRPSGGRATIYIGANKIKTVDFYASITKYRQVVPIKTYTRPHSGRLRVIVKHTKSARSRGFRVELDGFGVKR